MVVRAARAVPAGGEVTISYLGRPQLAPVEPRRLQLADLYGFECDCERCALELHHMDKVRAWLQG